MRPRIRSVKPDLFHDEKLWSLGDRTGLPVLQGFQGLWCYADREGRFEWRPLALKSLILPYWSGNFGEILDALHMAGMIVRYEVDGRTYGLVKNLKKHQTVNAREPASVLPPPPDTCTHVHARAEHAPVTELHVHARAEPPPDTCTHVPSGSGSGVSSGNGNGSGSGVVALHPGSPLPPSSRELGAFGAPALRFDWDPEWLPDRSHQARALELGLTDEDVSRRLIDCQTKTFAHGFRTEDKQFMRELGWEATDKKTRLAKEARNGTHWERSGAHRQAGSAEHGRR